MILCSRELENVLDRKTVHISQIRDLVSRQITRAFEYPVRILDLGQLKLRIPEQYGLHRKTCIAPHLSTSKMARFKIKPLFIEVIRFVEGTNQKKSVFMYKKICKNLSEYIIDRRDKLFDVRYARSSI